MKFYFPLLLSVFLLVSCSEGTQPESPRTSDFNLSTVEGICRYVMKLAENDPHADSDYVRSITDITCTTADNTLEEWQCVKGAMENGKTLDQAELDCFMEH